MRRWNRWIAFGLENLGEAAVLNQRGDVDIPQWATLAFCKEKCKKAVISSAPGLDSDREKVKNELDPIASESSSNGTF